MFLFVLYLFYGMAHIAHFVNERGKLTLGTVTEIITGGDGSMIVEANYCVEGQQYSTTRSLEYEFLYESIGQKYLVIYDESDHGNAHLFYELSLNDSLPLCQELDSVIDIGKLDLSFWAVNWSTDIVDIETVKKPVPER